MGLSLARALRLVPDAPARVAPGAEPPTVAFVGAGGKTTVMFRLARELRPPVVVTTTTHLGAWQASEADQHVVLEATGRGELVPHGVTLVTGSPASDDKLSGLAPEVLLWLHDMARDQHFPLLMEADGAHRKPLKAPAEHEPVIPSFSTLVAVVAGLTGLGTPLDDENVHRAALFGQLSGLAIGQPVTPDALVRVLIHSDGGLKGIPQDARRVALLNQADSPELQSVARRLAPALLASYESVVVLSAQQGDVHAVQERVAGIVLAAGSSERLGSPKQLLDWRGQPFVRRVASVALEAGLDPVVVVVGAQAQAVQAALDGIPVQIAENKDWRSGQASSIRAGLAALPGSNGAAIFLLADQPQVTPDVLRALVEEHAAGLHPIVAPLVLMERRANPVLFDRDTFADLRTLSGDVGGRAVFDRHRVQYLPWHDDRLLLDVDTQADYRRLVEDDTL